MQYVAPYREAHCAFEVDELIEKFASEANCLALHSPKPRALVLCIFIQKPDINCGSDSFFANIL